MSVESANNKAIQSKIRDSINFSDKFRTTSSAVLWLGLIGAAIYVVVGFIPTCPPSEGSSCYESDKGLFNVGLIGLGLGVALSAAWIYFASMTIIARVELAAVLANKDN